MPSILSLVNKGEAENTQNEANDSKLCLLYFYFFYLSELKDENLYLKLKI